MSKSSQMISFIRVVEAGSIKRAAQQMHLTPPAVSKKLKLLEDDIGFPLLSRSSRKFILTKIGREFYNHCKKVEKEMVSANSFIESLRNEAKGQLKITASVYVAESWLLTNILEFQERYPLIQINLEINDHIPNMEQENIDILIGFVLSEKMPATLKQQLMFKDKSILCASPKYLVEHGLPKAPLDLQSHKFINNPLRKPIDQIVFEDGTKIVMKSPNFIINNILALKNICSQGAGIMQVASIIVDDEINDGRLVQVLPDYPLSDPHISLFYQDGGPSSFKIRCFIDFVMEKKGKSVVSGSIKGETDPPPRGS